MTAYLVAPDVVAVRMGLEGLDSLADDRQETLKASLLATSTHLETYLRHASFDVAEQPIEDTFMVRSDEFDPEGGGLLLAMSRGFIDPDTLTVKLSTTLAGLTSAPVLEADTLYVDAELGTVLITGRPDVFSDPFSYYHRGSFFALVTYESGFIVTGGVYNNAPAWLVEAATLITINAYKNGLDCENASAGDLVDSCKLGPMLGAHIRYTPSAITPLRR